MKVKLLRATMIAGTPTSAGSIVDVDQHIGSYLTGVGKAEEVVEACPAPSASKETVVESKPTDTDKTDFSLMTKAELEAYGRDLGIELDKRQNKTDLIEKLEEFIASQDEN